MRAAGLRIKGNDVSKRASFCVVLAFVLSAALLAWLLYPHLTGMKAFGNDESSAYELSFPDFP